MNFDHVVDHQHLPICSGTSEQVKEFLKNRTDEENAAVNVYEEKTQLWFTVKEYLERP